MTRRSEQPQPRRRRRRTRRSSVLSTEGVRDGADMPRRARIEIVARPLWRIRVLQTAPRSLFLATCFAGLLASARFAIAPPRAIAPPEHVAAPAPDLAARGYATLFA